MMHHAPTPQIILILHTGATQMTRKRIYKINTEHPCAHCGKNYVRGANKFCDECIQQGYDHREQRKGLEEKKTDRGRRSYLIRTQGHRCELCGLSEWRGQPIPLQLDHVDGNYQNNTAENLRLLCATCHTMTQNYRSNNRGQGRHRRKQAPTD
jgi:hypothetical protein